MKSIQDFVRYAPATTRPPVRWPGGKRLAFWIVPNVEFLYDDSAINGARIEKVLREIRDGVPAADDGDQDP